MNEATIDYAGFVKLVLEALEAARVEYMIGGGGCLGLGGTTSDNGFGSGS